ncbi:cadherin repeat domain-containing protein [Fibrobacter sp. UWEL]|uniref:cadherin repeat domain-containing protein n=1 Tax=Fibrobacter sp. UWEL TaxID=1896209 RepID=UPI000919A618|nr:cadherin repeat domain-containing protein [Fibrobacter sp. UWEL]SHK67390.1 Cadherin domain-containing protein [Fibrobacter sp. UWEL]
MRFEIGLVKKLAIALAMVVSAGDALAASVSPMYFANVGSSYSVNSEKQEAFWTDLMKYKIFGAQGIYFLGQSIRVTDKSGWFGTAAGNFDMSSGNMHHVIGGPVLIGGNMIMSDGTDSITSGPVRVLGNITIPSETNWRGTGNVTAGYHCVGGTIANEFKKIMRADSSYSNDECPTAVPVINSDLRIPLLNAEKSYDNGIDLNNETKNIDIPAGEGTYDLYLDYINFVNKSYLNIRMPNKGRLTRIFLKNGFPSITSNTRIRVVYMSEDARYNNSTKEWASGTNTYVDNKNYAGNLLFYTNKDIDFDALSSTDSIQGSFITTGTINVRQSMTLAGQLLADKVTINAFFDGSGFHYVPFDPPELGDPETNSWGTLEEGIKTPQALSVVLSKAPETDVSFKYCFEFKGTENRDAVDENDVYASLDDIVKDANRIVCNGESVFGTATFKAGSTKLSEPIVLTVFDDGFVENEEHFSIHIFDLEGAVMADQSREGRFDISIKDNDDVLSGQDESINATEDTPYIFGKSDFTVLTRKGETWTGDYSIRILEVSGKGALTIDKKAVELGRNIPSKDILDGKLFGGLIYTPADNDYGSARATFTFVVVRGENIVSEDTYTMTINVAPVNDAPVLSPVTFKIKENVVRGDVNGDDYATGSLSAVIEDVDDDEFTYKFDDTFDAENTEENYKKVTSLYDLDPVTGKIVVHEDAVLNYESADSLLQIRVVATDKSSSTTDLSDAKSGKTIITIQMLDVNEKPVMDAQSFEIPENSIKGTPVGTVVATDPDRKTVPFGQLEYAFLEENTTFAITSSGAITVLDGSKLDYEKVKSFTFDVVVSDKGTPSLKDTATITVNLIDVNEPPVIPDDGKDHYDVKEHSKKGSVVTKIEFTDEDNADAKVSDFVPTLTDNKKVSGKVSAEDLFALSIEKDDDGKFFIVVSVKDSAKLNYEDLATNMDEKSFPYDVTISLKDQAGATGCNEVSIDRKLNVIDINEIPSTKDASFNPKENIAAGTIIGTVEASDPDIKNVKFSTLSYEVIDDVPFKMDSNKVVVADSKALNYEKVTEFYFDVRVTDGGGLTDIATVYVKLTDEEEPPEIIIVPECDPAKEICHTCDAMIEDCDDPDDPPDTTCTENCGYVKNDTVYVNVRENSATGTKILEYYVKDEDAGDLQSMEVSFKDMNKSGSDTLFTITPALIKDDKGFKFILTVTDGDKLDYEKTNHVHVLTITVKDDAGLTDKIVRVINIVDVNEPPYIVKDEFDLNEHNKVGAVVGTIEWGDDRDMDGVSNPAFRDNRVVAVDGATDVFDVDSMGVITVKKTLNYETDDTTYTLNVKVEDKNDPTLSSSETMIIHLKNVLETPVITSTEFTIAENPADRAVIGTLTSEDMDDLKNEEKRTYTLIGTSDYVKVTEDGEIVVVNKDKFDFEKIESFTIKVKVTDPQKVSSDTTVTIKITDVNEAPNLDDKVITVSEHTAPKTDIDTLKATDPDTKKKEFRDLTYTIVDGDTSLFKVDPKTGVVTLKDSLDYETAKEHILKVEVNDGEFADTAKITVAVENVIERSVVEIQMVDDGDSVFVRPDSVFTNRPDVTICWTEDARDYCQDTTLTEGIHTIIKTYKDPKKDFAGADTVVIQLSTSAPQVIISAKADDLGDGGIFTLDETVIAGDTNIYVKDSKNDIKVTIKDPVNKKDSSFTVKLDLETVNVSSKDLESVSSVLDQGKLTLNENPKIPASRTPVNGSEVRVDYTEEVNGKTVTVTYYTDKNGEVLKTPVIIDGKVDSIEVITVSYKTEIGGREVVVSYQADAVTGQVLNVASDGALTTDDKIEVAVVPDGKPSESDTTVSKTTDVSVGSFKVTYEYEDEKHNTVVVTYTVDEKGNIVKNADGDIGYNVSYTYENKFGNAATQSVFIVLDQTPPVVKIVSPVMMEKIRANSVEVVWTVNGVVQDTLTLQGLKKGFQKIKREYRDKAGNVAADSVTVQVKDAKSMDIEVVEAVTEMDLEKVEEYYASNPPKKGETFAISVENPSTGKELEVLTGGSYGQEEGSFDTPYPGVEGNGHLGPTVAMEIRLPVVNDVAGLATFDDLVLSDGTISSRGVNSDRCKTADEYEAMGLDVDSLAQDTTVCVKFTQEQYVEKYCEDDFDISGDLSKINMYTTKMHAKVWIYTSLGGFVDYYGFKIDLDDPEYTDKAGVLNMYFEQKPDKDGEVRTEDGRVLSTGAYLYKVEADIRAKLRCSLPPFEPKANGAGKMKGQVLKKSDELLKPFGYKRPVKK